MQVIFIATLIVILADLYVTKRWIIQAQQRMLQHKQWQQQTQQFHQTVCVRLSGAKPGSAAEVYDPRINKHVRFTKLSNGPKHCYSQCFVE